jgi:hypothetical protein
MVWRAGIALGAREKFLMPLLAVNTRPAVVVPDMSVSFWRFRPCPGSGLGEVTRAAINVMGEKGGGFEKLRLDACLIVSLVHR